MLHLLLHSAHQPLGVRGLGSGPASALKDLQPSGEEKYATTRLLCGVFSVIIDDAQGYRSHQSYDSLCRWDLRTQGETLRFPAAGQLLTVKTRPRWRRKWQPTPVFLPGESHGQRSVAGHGPWGRRESDMTEATKHAPGWGPGFCYKDKGPL